MKMSELVSLGSLFFRASAQALVTSLLDGAGRPGPSGDAFLTLDAVNFMASANNNLEERLVGIADCAESESGQTILRDLILSFRLPRSVVGVRRTSLLGRESNKLATENHSELLGSAHDAAMRGAKWTFENDEDPLNKMASLLAGLAVMMCASAQSVRKDDMFNGRVALPFLETTPPQCGTMRLVLLEASHEWVVYALGTSGSPTVHFRQRGFDGFLQAVVLFANSI